MFRSHFTENDLQPAGNLLEQNIPSVLGTPYDMIFARIDNIAIASIELRVELMCYIILRGAKSSSIFGASRRRLTPAPTAGAVYPHG